MLTQAEMQDARDRLRSAGNLIEAVRVVFLSAGYVQGARLLNGAAVLIADEVAALDKAIATGGQP
jgi:hypothetical protein